VSKDLEYEVEVTRTEIRSITPRDVERCKVWRRGQADRNANRGCLSANGCYLDGWYAPTALWPPYVSLTAAVKFNL